PTATYTLSLHDALPISRAAPETKTRKRKRYARVRATSCRFLAVPQKIQNTRAMLLALCKLLFRAAPSASVFQRSITNDYKTLREDRKSTRLNSSHVKIS